MRTIFVAILFVAMPWSSIAQEVPTATPAPSREQLDHILTSRYEVIAGAMHLNDKCKVLSEPASQMLERDVVDLGAYIQRRKLVSDEILLAMQENAKQMTNISQYADCSDAAKQAVETSAMLASMLHEDLVDKTE